MRLADGPDVTEPLRDPVRVLAIRNCELEGFGLYEGLLLDRGAEVREVHAYRGAALPRHRDVDAIMVGGTPTSAYEVQEHAFLRRECAWLADAVNSSTPCLGICCGAQILAMLLGARVGPAPAPEIGTYEVRLTEDGRRDELLAGFPASFPVFHWHGDAFDVPASGSLLAVGDGGNEVFRHGNVLGLQFHLEVTAAEAAHWALAYDSELTGVRKTVPEVVAECRAAEPFMAPLAGRLIEAFLDLATATARPLAAG